MILARHHGTINYMVLIKLLYFADRQSLIETGQPITGDRMVSMPHGPVLSQIYEFISWGKPVFPRPWFEYISDAQGYDVSLAKTGWESDELSPYEIELLEKIDGKYGHLNKWAIRDISHNLPEWQNPHGSSLPIDPADILRAAGKSDLEIERITAEAEEMWFLKTLQAANP